MPKTPSFGILTIDAPPSIRTFCRVAFDQLIFPMYVEPPLFHACRHHLNFTHPVNGYPIDVLYRVLTCSFCLLAIGDEAAGQQPLDLFILGLSLFATFYAHKPSSTGFLSRLRSPTPKTLIVFKAWIDSTGRSQSNTRIDHRSDLIGSYRSFH